MEHVYFVRERLFFRYGGYAVCYRVGCVFLLQKGVIWGIILYVKELVSYCCFGSSFYCWIRYDKIVINLF